MTSSLRQGLVAAAAVDPTDLWSRLLLAASSVAGATTIEREHVSCLCRGLLVV